MKFALVTVPFVVVALGCATVPTLNETVDDKMVETIEGKPKARIDAARAEVATTGEGFAKQKARVDGAEKGLSDAKGSVSVNQKTLGDAKAALGKAQRRLRFARAAEELATLQLAHEQQAFREWEHAMLVSRAKLELAKFEAVGIVNASGGPEFEQRRAAFLSQLAESESAYARQKGETASIAMKVESKSKAIAALKGEI